MEALRVRGELEIGKGAVDVTAVAQLPPETRSQGCLPQVTFEYRIQGRQESQPLVSGEMSAETSLSEKVNGRGNIRLGSQLK